LSNFNQDFGMVAYYANHFATMFLKILSIKQKSTYTVFDVGFNTGQFTRLTIKAFDQFKNDGLVSKESKLEIFAFEPNFHLINASPKFENLKISNLALSDKQGNCTLYIPIMRNEPDDLEYGSKLHRNEYGGVYGISTLGEERRDDIIKNIDNVRWQQLPVETDTLDNFCLRNNISEIDWLKIDVEAFEKNVLVGSKRMLSEGRILAGQFEGDTKFNADVKISTALGNNHSTQDFINECEIVLFDANYIPIALPTSNRLVENEFFFTTRKIW